MSEASHLDTNEKARLTTWLVNQRAQGVPVPEVSTSEIQHARLAQALSVPSRRDRMLAFLVLKSDRVGSRIRFIDGSDLTQELFAHTESLEGEEVRFLLGSAADEGWIERQILSSAVDATVLLGGYEHFERFRSQVAASTQGFVAMWFDGSMSDIYAHGIAPGIEDAGYKPMRIDQKQHNNKIDDEIIAEIRRSRFLIADFTHGEAGPRGGVYYEAGFAHGLGIPVIFCVREDMIEKAHFDTRQYAHILWSAPADLRQKLAARISATIGDGPRKALA